jgi:hypothetical protein
MAVRTLRTRKVIGDYITAASTAVRPPISDPDGRTRHQPIIVFDF